MRLKKISALSLAAAISVCTVPAFGAAETENVNVPKYNSIILIIKPIDTI